MPAKTDSPSRQVLDELPSRALKLLSTISKVPAIRGALAARGYSEQEHQEGWDLLLKVSGFPQKTPEATNDEEVSKAIAALDAWDEPNFRILRAALDRHHPAQGAFVFHNLEPSTGAGAVLSVATLLDRLDALEGAPERKATRKADHAALALLAKRGVDEAERKRLRELVQIAQRPASAAPATEAADDGEQQATFLKLYAWYSEWSETARALIKRRDHLIRMGLAKRKPAARKGKANADAPAPEP
jgi:hypothetical protein